jgi:hypothetical protein
MQPPFFEEDFMIGRARLSTRHWRVLRWAAVAAAAPALWACTSRTLETPVVAPTETVTATFTQKVNNELDLLFMIDNSSSMTEMQSKLYDQLPLFMQALEALPNPPSLHVAVVSSDMGAPSDTNIGCGAGNQGQFQSMAQGACTGTSLASGATFISDADMTPNYTDATIAEVFQCIALLGDKGCGFEHQLASIDRALGSDSYQGTDPSTGLPIPTPPSTNAGFLRPEAYLGIVILTNEDDCSAPAGSTIYSANGYPQNISDPDGPITNYRCNGGPRGAHRCQDPANGNAWIVPPLNPPADAQGTAAAPTLDLANCQDNETGSSALTPVSQFVSDIKQLKSDPDNQILVAAITAPAAPYTVRWASPEEVSGQDGQDTKPGELWPEVEHSCGTKGGDDVNPEATMNPSDTSFGDPGVRVSQFVSAFPNYVLASICDDSYASSMQQIADKLGQLITPPCIAGTIQKDAMGQPMCSVIEHQQDMQGNKKDSALQNCNENGNALPCWTLKQGGTDGGPSCNGQQLDVIDPPGTNTQSESSTINCSICLPGSTASGC